MEKCGKIYDFGQKIGADLCADFGRFCRLELADGRDINIYHDGRIVVDDYEWTPPATMLEYVKGDLEYV